MNYNKLDICNYTVCTGKTQLEGTNNVKISKTSLDKFKVEIC